MKLRQSFLLATALTCLLAACGGGSGSGAGDDTVQPRAGGSLTVLSIADARGLDPFGATYNALVDEPRMAALYDPLFTVDAATGEVHPHLGRSLTTADDGATWTLTLRPDVRFSDGTALDAEAVRVNWDMHARPETGSLHRGAAAGLRLEVTGPLTLLVTPPARNVLLDRAIATELTYIAAPSVLAKGPEEYRAHPVGAGPFTLQSWTRGSRMEFAKNPTYWQYDNGLPRLDKLTIAITTDVTQAYNTVRSGGAHLFVAADPPTLDKAENDLNVAAVPTGGGQSLAFNLTRAPFDDTRARRAVALALDPRELAATLGASYRPAKSVFPQTSPFYDPAATQPAPDKAEAQRLFDELAAAGKPVDFTLLTPQNPQARRIAEFLQSRLAAFRNTAMRIQGMEIGAFVATTRVNRNFQAAMEQSWQADPEPAMYQAFRSAGPLNITGWNNPRADQALDTSRTDPAPQARKQAYSELQRALAADLPIWTFAESRIGPVWNDRVAGVSTYNAGVPFLDRIGLRP
ncbi:ABC transporter substrate-binding protein [Streptomycetaceae bacterium NBC_01309]